MSSRSIRKKKSPSWQLRSSKPKEYAESSGRQRAGAGTFDLHSGSRESIQASGPAERRHGVLAVTERDIEWPTLAFFGFLFIIVGAAVETGLVGSLAGALQQGITSGSQALGLSETEKRMLNEVPYRGTGTPMPPTDPLIYRFYEMVMVNGPAWKALIEEEFGDGIMSAIDFNIAFEREPNPKGDRVRITMSGKFLPYKYYGNEQGIPDYGFKEE